MSAFLERDQDKLLAIRERVTQHPPKGMTAVYPGCVESFVDRFDGS